MANPQHMGDNSENRGTVITNLRKNRRELLFDLEKRKKKTKKLSKIIRKDEQENSVKSAIIASAVQV